MTSTLQGAPYAAFTGGARGAVTAAAAGVAALAVEAATPATSGWVVVDPAGYACAWYSAALAVDEAAALGMFQPAPVRRGKLVVAGWSVRAGGADELICGTADIRASA